MNEYDGPGIVADRFAKTELLPIQLRSMVSRARQDGPGEPHNDHSFSYREITTRKE